MNKTTKRRILEQVMTIFIQVCFCCYDPAPEKTQHPNPKSNLDINLTYTNSNDLEPKGQAHNPITNHVMPSAPDQ